MPQPIARHQLLGPLRLVGTGEHRDATPANARDPAHDLLELVGEDVPAGADDDVLLAAAEVKLPFGDVAAIARRQPAIAAGEQRRGGARVAQVSAGRRRSAELDVPLTPATGKLGRTTA